MRRRLHALQPLLDARYDQLVELEDDRGCEKIYEYMNKISAMLNPGGTDEVRARVHFMEVSR